MFYSALIRQVKIYHSYKSDYITIFFIVRKRVYKTLMKTSQFLICGNGRMDLQGEFESKMGK